MSIYTGIPVGHAVNSIVNANTVMNMPNAQVIGNENVQATNFAPNLIPSSDKGINYTIESIDGSMYKLSEINKWVNFEFLNLIHSKNPPSQPISSLLHPYGTNAAATQIYNICKNAGWSKEAICAMLGNFSVESYINPTQGQLGGGYGLAQWNSGYLEEYAQEAGVSIK